LSSSLPFPAQGPGGVRIIFDRGVCAVQFSFIPGGTS